MNIDLSKLREGDIVFAAMKVERDAEGKLRARLSPVTESWAIGSLEVAGYRMEHRVGDRVLVHVKGGQHTYIRNALVEATIVGVSSPSTQGKFYVVNFGPGAGTTQVEPTAIVDRR